MSPYPAQPLMRTELDLPNPRRGKVRDVFDLGPDRLLIVASDRISAFDVVMPTPIVGKGELLTRLSTFWLTMIKDRRICDTHLISTDIHAGAIPPAAFHSANDGSLTTLDQLAGRSTIARRAKVIPIECVVRGYLEGSGWREYQATGSVCGISLPAGLRQCDRLPEPIFTPATKEEMGRHDENISFARACELVGSDVMTRLRELSLKIYTNAAQHALQRGIIIADTKFEFGLPLSPSGVLPAGNHPDALILVDEALTPDSSRFWPSSSYEPGRAQASFDKQFLREYLESLVAKGLWNKQAPGPTLPPDVVEATRAKYAEACDRLMR